jgi:uncharacterized protein YlxW (UPF0749 family)
MSLGIKETLKDAVRQMSFRTSLDSLKKKGVQQVSVLGVDRIVGLIEQAVHRSLKSHLIGLEREAVADATKAEFLRLLRSNEDLQREKSEIQQLRERAEEEIDQLRRELARDHRTLQTKLSQGSLDAAARYAEENAEIAAKVRLLRQSLPADAPAGLFEQRLMELIMDVVSGERSTADSARQALRDREVENLQRRIAKLTETLSSTEHRLQQVAAMKAVDGGISSLYREVQGLADGDSQVGKKKELMAEIFKANLKLQKRSQGSA